MDEIISPPCRNVRRSTEPVLPDRAAIGERDRTDSPARQFVKYRKFDPRTWKDERFATLSNREKLVAIYMFTAQANRIGLFDFSPGQAAEDLGWSSAMFNRAFARVIETFDWEWDPTARVLYIPTWWRYNCPENPSHLQGCLRDLNGLPTTRLVASFRNNTRYLPPNLAETFIIIIADVGKHVPDKSATPASGRELHQEHELELEQELKLEQEREQDGSALTGGPSHPPTAPFTVDMLAELWNTIVATPRCNVMTGQRLKRAHARLRAHPDREFWERVVRRITQSAFLRGKVPGKPWVAGIDWILKDDLTCETVLEGKYDSRNMPTLSLEDRKSEILAQLPE